MTRAGGLSRGLGIFAGFAGVWLAAACSSPAHEFEECDEGWTEIAGVCQQTCDSTCPDGQQCTNGLCVDCTDGECPRCGDGTLDDAEACDDGNLAAGDGCSNCAVDDDWKCDKASPSACDCAVGLQDNDEDGTCSANCASAALDCGARGACSDTSGTPQCQCDPGYQDNDNDDGCKPDCDTARLQCGDNAACTDKSGAASCVCDPGYQDEDSDGVCLPACSQTECGLNASCDDASGTAACSCDETFQDNDGDGDCGEDCSETDCGLNGVCDDSSGSATCDCAAGYQDNDGMDGCAPDCATAALTCQQNQSCDDSSGAATCACNPDYQDNDDQNGCAPTCTKANLSCGIHASCDDSSGTASCVCDAHYRDPGNDGACEAPTCYTNASSCGATNYCAVETEECTTLPKVPNGDFSCKSGGVCDLGWAISTGFNVGSTCSGGLSMLRSAHIQKSFGVNNDYRAVVSIPIPAYATIDPPSASAGPLALTFATGQTCHESPLGGGPTCASQAYQPGRDAMVSVDGRQRQRFTGGGTASCSLQQRTVCLDQTSYGHDVEIVIAPDGGQLPMDMPQPAMLLTFTKVALVRDASCPTPGIVPFKVGDWGGAVSGTVADPYLDFVLSEYCATTEAQSLLAVPNDLSRPALEFEVTATPNGNGVYPDIKVGWSGPTGGGNIGTYPSAATKTVVRACLPAALKGQVNRYSLTGTGTGPCSPTAPTLQVRKVTIVGASAAECP